MRRLLAVAGKSLPVVFICMNVPLIIEPLARHHTLRGAWSDVYLPLLFGEPFLVALGILGAIFILRPQRVGSLRRHIAAGVIAVAALVVLSIYNQGAHLPFIISAAVGAGLLAGLIAFGVHAQRAAAASS